jgi:PKD repeat protein
MRRGEAVVRNGVQPKTGMVRGALATVVALAAVAAVGAPSASATPTCTNPSMDTERPHEGKTVTVTRGLCLPPGPTTQTTLNWSRCDDPSGTVNCAEIPEAANQDSYTPQAADVGKHLLVEQVSHDSTMAADPPDRGRDVSEEPVNGNPTADFTFTQPVRANEQATFTASSTDPDDQNLTNEWDLDNDGEFDDASGSSVPWTFTSQGDHTVRLRTTDGPDGGSSIATKVVNVKGPPVADFTVSPQSPFAGQTVTLTSTSSDPDNDPLSYAWDLDGDGDYSDGAFGTTVSHAFSPAGNHGVGLKVTADGQTSIKSVTVIVRGTGSSASPPTTGQASPRLLSPFPVVTISGRLIGNGVRLSLLSIRAPKGARVTVRCRGRRCPYKRASHLSRTGRVRFRKLERALTAGTVIEVFVTRSGSIGKYTRFRIRAGRVPARRDRCLRPGSSRPSPCPSQ